LKIEFGKADSLAVSDNVIPITIASVNPSSQRFRRSFHSADPRSNYTFGIASIKNVKDEVFMTSLQVGGQDFNAVIDLGSSDTWLAMTGYKCLEKENPPKGLGGKFAPLVDGVFGAWQKIWPSSPQCKFGRTYDETKTFSQIPNQHFNTSFTDGEFARGYMGKETVRIGNITIVGQPMGFVDKAAWQGDGVSSGILGLAFPSITNAFTGTDPHQDRKGANNVPYPPIFTNMHRTGLIRPYFSMALNRASEEPGVLALGGLPGAPIRHTGNFVRVPMQHLAMRAKASNSEDGMADYRFYVANIDGFAVDSRLVSNSTQVIIDSGSRFSHLPKAVVDDFESRWIKDGASVDSFTGELMVPCNKTPPKLGVVFDGMTIHFDANDLILKGVAGTKYCVSTIARGVGVGKDENNIHQWPLGAPFLRSVVAVFDVGAGEMRFAERLR
jgi:Eukaryotic aspartyl protease